MIRLLIPDTEMELQAMEFKRQFSEDGEHTICGSYIKNTTLTLADHPHILYRQLGILRTGKTIP